MKNVITAEMPGIKTGIMELHIDAMTDIIIAITSIIVLSMGMVIDVIMGIIGIIVDIDIITTGITIIILHPVMDSGITFRPIILSATDIMIKHVS